MKLLLLGILVLLLLLSVCLFAMVQYRKNLDKQINHILEILDRALDGQKTLAVFDESADAAISERINRLLDISNASYRKADEERNVVKSLIADISHQVRTPLTNIMLYTGLLAEAEIDDQSRALTQKIQAQTEKLDFFMKELVHSSYLESDMLALHPAFSGTAELLGLVCQAEELQAMKKHISFQISSEDFQAFFDMKWTAEALGNILNNAVKYAPKGSEIQLFAESYDSFIRIHVRDQGPGISEKEQGMIFQRFYRSPSVSQEKGLGIGLYLAREILAKEGGYIKVDSSPGKGSDFSVFLSRHALSNSVYF